MLNNPSRDSDQKKPPLDIRDLSVNHRDAGFLVKNVNIEVAQGEILGLVGESGSGKSTTALAVVGFYPPRSAITGEVLVNGKQVNGKGDAVAMDIRYNDVGVVFQDPMSSFNPRLTIGAQLREALKTEDRNGPHCKQLTIELLERARVPFPEQRLRQYPHQLSGGLLQRCMIAMALARNPSILIADEPTTALDVTVQKEILELLTKLRDESKIAILLISHDLHLVGRYADRVAVMHRGEVIEIGSPSSVLHQPQHTYTKELIAASPAIQPEEEMETPPPNRGNVLIDVQDVSKAYKSWRGLRMVSQTVLNNVSLEVRQGESVGIVGESGSGKSTLAKLLVGLEQIDRGNILLGSTKVLPLSRSRKAPWRRNIHLMFQDSHGSLDPLMTVEQIIAEPLHGSAAQNRRDVTARLEEVGLTAEYLTRYPSELSGGQRQRIALARALITNPNVMIADEPVSALDVFNQSRIINLIKKIHKEREFTLLLISHDMAVITSLCDRIAVMKNGEFVEVGPTKEIIYHPKHDYTKTLIDASLNMEQA